MAKRFNVYGVGNALVDLQVQVQESDLAVHRLVKGGMQLVSASEQDGLVAYFRDHQIHRASGGSVANSVIALAQLGGKSAYGCVVGDDGLGRFYQEEMAGLGISLYNPRMSGEKTGSCFILITPDAERTMNTTLAASALFGPRHVSAEFIKDSEWLYIEGYLLSSEVGQAAALEAVKLAKQSGTKVVVSFSDGFIVEHFGAALREIVSQSDLLFANHVEVQAFTRTANEEESFRAFSQCAPSVIMTMHERGARLMFDGNDYHVDAVPVRAVDTTGAGDMFAGAFLYGLTHDYSVEESGRLACFLASQIVGQVGPRIMSDVRGISGIDQVLRD